MQLDKNMRFTKSDKKILELVERWGYLTIADVQQLIKKTYATAAWRLGRLEQMELVKSIRALTGEKVYFVGGTPNINLSVWRHDQKARRLAGILSDEMDCDYLTIGELKRKFGGQLVRIPDFALEKDGQIIFCELELNKKSSNVLRGIFQRYNAMQGQGLMLGVNYYFEDENILNYVQKLAMQAGVSNLINFQLIDEVK